MRTGIPQDRHEPGTALDEHVRAGRPAHRSVGRDPRAQRYVISQAVRLACFLAAALLPLPMVARLALVAASIALPWGAVIAANAAPARIRLRSTVTATETRETWCYRLRWRLSYALLQAYGPAQLSGDGDPRQRLLTERSSRRSSQPV